MAPLWPRVSGLLERDVATRSQLLGAHGLRRVIETLHPRVHWRGHSIIVDAGPEPDERRLAGEGLVLMPSAFIWPAVAVIVDPPWRPTIAYPAPGVELLWEPVSGPPEALERLLGRTRALVLAAIERPLSTTAIAVVLPGAAGGDREADGSRARRCRGGDRGAVSERRSRRGR